MPGNIDLNKPIDYEASITIAANGSEASINITPPVNGGAEPTFEDLMNKLRANGVLYGIREDILHKIVDQQLYGTRMVIALWTPAVEGVNGEIEYKFDKQVKAAPTEDERGFVDYKDLGLVRTVRKGEVIADITLPIEGSPGKDVRGRVLKQRVGKKAAFSVGTNTELTEDGLHIISSVDGNINFRNGAFSVEQVVTVGDVDASVGNIKFIGDVIVKGEVFEGFTISSNANIIVHGNVNGASLEADGDVTIKKGCINSKIIAHGSVTAQFCEHSTIECDGDITSSNFVICTVYCGGELKAKGNSHSGLLGGKYTCLNGVEASNIGTKNYTPTLLTVGDNAILAEEKENVLKQIEKTTAELEKVVLVINFLNEKKKELKSLPEDKEVILGNAARQKVMLGMEIKKLKKRVEEIDISLASKQFLSVDCKGYIYPGVKIIINDSTFAPEAEYVRTRVAQAPDGTIRTSPL